MKKEGKVTAQTTLFGDEPKPARKPVRGPGEPLAGRMRPDSLDGFVGQEHLLGEGKVLRMMIEQDRMQSMILWGPPGVGKTTLAHIIAVRTSAEFIPFSAVTGSAKQVRAIMDAAEKRRASGRRTVLFVDEIHRFNKAQQDAFLPYVEKGSIILIGATTENPSFQVNSALLSRCKVFVLKPLSEDDVAGLILRAAEKGFPGTKAVISDDLAHVIARFANGDARTALNTLEAAASDSPTENGAIMVSEEAVADCVSRRSLLYDKTGEEHYNLISAFHKSMRNSDPDAAVYWLARMLDGGEDPCYIARRMIEFSGDDVGMADPNAMLQAVSCFFACKNMGMPECRFALAQTAIYLSLAPRSDSVAKAIEGAMADVRGKPNEPVPMQLRNAETKLMEQLGYGKGYQYPEGTEAKVTKMQCLPDGLKDRIYYEPGNRGNEAYISKRLQGIRDWKAGRRGEPPE